MRFNQKRFTAYWILAVAAFTLVFWGCAQKKAAAPVDFEALSAKLVNSCAGIHEGDCVLINGGIHDFELLEDIAVQVRKAGAFPLVTVGSDRMNHRLVADVPQKWDTQLDRFNLGLNGIITATIGVSYNENPDLFSDIAPERIAAINKANSLLSDLAFKRGIRYVNLGNGLYPSEALAKRFGLTLDELTKIFWQGVNTDYGKLRAACDAVKTVLSNGRKIHLIHPNGTDLTLTIEKRPVFTSDGVISAEDVKHGGAAVNVWLPAGEAFLAPVPGTAEGRVVSPRDFYMGKEVKGLALTFNKGKLVSMKAESGLENFKKVYDAYGPGKERFGYIDIGTNPDVRIPAGSTLTTFVASGMVTVGIGNNLWAGGDNNTPFGTGHFLPGCTLTVDGNVLIDNGVLKM